MLGGDPRKHRGQKEGKQRKEKAPDSRPGASPASRQPPGLAGDSRGLMRTGLQPGFHLGWGPRKPHCLPVRCSLF